MKKFRTCLCAHLTGDDIRYAKENDVSVADFGDTEI